MTSTKGLRFAPLIRVSDEAQEKRGESLRTQKKQIREYVRILGGKVTDRCWRYTGQEHATPEHERKLLERLLQDASTNLFDAIIVCDASRWSRDNEKAKPGLRILRNNDIRFFIGTSEYNLHDPEHKFFLGLSAEIGELQASQQTLKSMVNRIERAKRGIPSVGGRPYGRTFDKKTETWHLDREKQKKIMWAARQYLKGVPMKQTAKALGMHPTYLHRILTQRAGDEWEIHFKSEELKIDETVPIKVPRLLPQKTIDAVREKARANQTYAHGHTKHKYLLARMIFCGGCGEAMFGQKGKYYRHHPKNYKQCQHIKYVRSDLIENAVLVHIFQMFGNVDGLAKAMERAIPNVKERRKLLEDKKLLQKQLDGVEKETNNIVRAIAKGIITDKVAKREMGKLEESEAQLTKEIEAIAPLVEDIPTKKAIRQMAGLMKREIRAMYTSTRELAKMTYEQQRKLVQFAFGGLDKQGRRLGVYVDRTGDTWSYIIRGKLDGIAQGQLPMDLRQAADIMSWGDALEMFGSEEEYNRFLAQEAEDSGLVVAKDDVKLNSRSQG